MWKQNADTKGELTSTEEPVRPVGNGASNEGAARQRPAASDQATIGKGIVVKGEVSGADAVFVDGRVEGSIYIPGERVTVGRHGSVVGATQGSPCITAREVVIMGTVTGDIAAGERVDLRAGGSLSGDVTTVRVSIEDGAYFHGGIDIRPEDSKTIAAAARFEAAQPA